MPNPDCKRDAEAIHIQATAHSLLSLYVAMHHGAVAPFWTAVLICGELQVQLVLKQSTISCTVKFHHMSGIGLFISQKSVNISFL